MSTKPDARPQFQGVVELTRAEWGGGSLSLESWESLLSIGHVLVFREVVNSAELRQRMSALLRTSLIPSDDKRVIEGVANIFYVASHEGIGQDAYSVKDLSYYFFPWNDDATGIDELAQPAFDLVGRLNGYDSSWLRKQTPKDGIVQRFHAICYPSGSGHISPHVDPVRVTRFTSGIYVTEYGKDYIDGGFYIVNAEGTKVFVDHEVKSGDMVVFPAHFAHGVDRVESNGDRAEPDLGFSGRIFLNMTIVESHEVEGRAFTIGAQGRIKDDAAL